MAATTAKIVAGVAGGYLLGRTKKLRLAITIAGLLAGKRLAADPKSIANTIVEKNPELGNLRGQLTEGLTGAAKELAMATAASRIEAMTQSLQDSASKSGGEEEPEDAHNDASEDDPPESEASDEDVGDEDATDEDSGGEDSGDEDTGDDEAADDDPPKRRGGKQTAKEGSRAESGRKRPSKSTAKRPAKKSASGRRAKSRSTASAEK